MIASESQQLEAKERILIVDDDEDIRNSLTLFLKEQDYEIEVAKDGQDGLEKIVEKSYNLVLLDIRLPDIDGIKLIIPIKEKQPEIEIIMITGNDDINSAINSLHKGASAYITKPLNLDELLTNIKNSIEKQHLIAEKQQTEQKLKESEEKYRELTEQSLVGVAIMQDNVFKFVNQRYAEIGSYNVKEMMNWQPGEFFKIVYPDDRERVMQQSTKKQRGDKDVINHYEFRAVAKTGNIIWIELYSKTIKYKGRPAAFITIIDITERKKAEKKLKESEEKYRELYENAPNAYFSVKSDKFIKGCNQPACELLGYNKKEILTMKVFDLYYNSPEGLQKAKRLFKQFLEGKNIQDEEIQMKHKNGNPFWTSLTVTPIRNQKGEIVESRSMVINITERKEAEEALKNSEHDLGERVKELTCLYELSKLVENLNISLEEVLQRTLDLIPPAWQFPEITCSRISFNGQEFKTKNFMETEWKLKVGIKRRDEIIGTIEVYYLKDKPIFDEGPFLKEERNLINACAEILGRYFERKMVEQAIQNRNKEILMLLDASRAVLQYNDFEIAQKRIFNCCNNLIGADAGYVAVLNASKKEYQKIFIYPGSLTCEVDPDLQMSIRGMLAKVIKSKKGLAQNDFSNTDWINFLPKGHIPLKNVLIAPLIINNEVNGIMGLTGREGGFTDEETRVVTAFAEIASISLFNSQTLESLEKSEQKYKRLSNILEQKVEERTIELKDSEEKIRNLINNISDILFEAEPSGILTYISPQITDLIGYQSEELIGLNFMDFVQIEDINSFKETADKALKTKKVVSIECRIKHKKGYFLPISARWSMVEINNELKVFGLVSDNTERKKIDDMIKREIKQLKELDQIRNDLVTRISHELNTPLISILNGSQYLLDFKNNKMSDEISNIVKIIYQGGYRLKDMVDNLITAYEIETEQIIFNIKRENLIPIIKECVEDLIFRAEKRKVFINLELPTDLNTAVDKRMIKKVILNLLSNAIKNTQPNGNIYIRSFEHHNFLDIIIRDTGVGLTEKEKPSLFKKFGKIERYGKGMDVDIEGPGLGLYIANEIVKLHVGEILVKSKGRNKGSTFILRLFLK
ncbi:hypothetical protein LCGC14_0905510 [marine sediment metagenome]|uniref:histidine kinase n=1 Tax=marine sediment metagenome TaxID=412755 RepID=A0A0F9S218_9ZZZZ